MGTRDHSMMKYDEELEAMRSRVLQMGGLVESQVRTALDAFEHADLVGLDLVHYLHSYMLADLDAQTGPNAALTERVQRGDKALRLTVTVAQRPKAQARR